MVNSTRRSARSTAGKFSTRLGQEDDSLVKSTTAPKRKRKAAAASAASPKKAKVAAKASAKGSKTSVKVSASAGGKTAKNKKAGLAGQDAVDDLEDLDDVAIDDAVSAIDAQVFKKGSIALDEHSDPYSARLAHVDPATNSDKYYILQLILKGKQRFVYRRNGRTGTAGQGNLEGPLDEKSAIALFTKTFKSKSGLAWGDRAGPVSGGAKHYTYLKQDFAARKLSSAATWEYHLTNDPMGKSDGWYAYDKDAGDEVEDLYLSYAVDGNDGMSIRYVASESSGFTYKVDLASNSQTNTQSGKQRPIRRVEESD